jgi:N-acyl-D-amino-acid deacylase
MMRNVLVASALVLLAAWGAHRAAGEEAYDLVIINGLIVDGTGRPGFRADIGVRNGRIVKIGPLAGAPARAKLDAQGQVVSPGFIDVHVHIEDQIKLSTSRFVADNFLLQGVTTVITGNCGRSAPDIGAFFRKLARLKLAINIATLVGHNTLRQEVCRGHSQPTPEETARMQALLRAGLRAGAVGFSTGLCYKPGIYASEGEVVGLVRVAAQENAIYATHLRDEAAGGQVALAEAVRTAERAGAPKLHISHCKAAGRAQWGTARARLDGARQSVGKQTHLTADLYPYTAVSSTLEYLIPPEAFPLLGGPAAKRPQNFARAVDLTLEKLRRDGWPDYSNVRVAFSEKHKEWIGRTIPDIVKSGPGGAAPVRDQAAWILKNQARGDVQVIAEEMSEPDVRQLITAPDMVFGSDSSVHYRGLGRPHPRGAGTFPRIFAEFVRDEKLLTLEDAVHRATGLAAEIFGLPERGLIREGYWADIVIFDPGRLQDRATFEDPWKPPEGIAGVVVNGSVAVRGTKLTGALAGRPVLRSAGGAL